MISTDLVLAFLLLAVAIALAYFVFASFAFGAGYQPTPPRAVESMLRLAEVGPNDTVFDLGAGTGAIVFRVVRTYRARAVAVEIEPIRVLILRLRRRGSPFADRLEIRRGNLFGLDFRPATVVTAFLWPGAMERLRPKLEAELRPGARVVSHHHAVPGWTPTVEDRENHVYLYRWPEAGRPRGVPTGASGGT
ncbi:MAG TPA: SAM-dependent methyltransferase [Thermoplasmata archaeon]|nr:SAM-dependent methyltransferase [Thermoplasmata archaeon]